MHTINDPRQGRLFDPYANVFSELAYDRILNGWQGVFRHVLLELMPVQELKGHFDPVLGRPTKELYSMAGLILIKEFFDWTNEAAAHAYMMHLDVQFALNLDPTAHSLAERSLERYLRIFREDELAEKVMQDVTRRLADALELNVDKQRLDSTHVFSDMATFGRTRLMGVTIKRFLTQVKRHASAKYAALPVELRQRYAASEHQMFGSWAKDADSRSRLRQQVAEDAHLLVERFADDRDFLKRSSYQALVQVFGEQCEVTGGTVTVKKHTGGNCVQNPSDPDATYDGKKGPGYQAQLSETCHEDNEVQLIVGALPQTAVESDAKALEPMLQELKETGMLPKEMTADTAYGSDENVLKAAEMNVELVSPVSGPTEDAHVLNADDFPLNEETQQVESCPAGRIPLETIRDAEHGTTTVRMRPEDCAACPFREECPMENKGDAFEAKFTDKQRRLDERRREQDTKPFRERYAKRAGLESTNSGLKRRMKFGKLRVRGRSAVFHVLRMKVTGWNVLRAAQAKKMRALVATKAAAATPRRRKQAMTGLSGPHRPFRGGRARPIRRSSFADAETRCPLAA